MNNETPNVIPTTPGSLQSSIQVNTSGMGKESIIPEEIKGWSWGGFLWTWIWGIGNKTWISLLGLISPINLIVAIILGIKGREWAWRNKKWDSVESFIKVQRNWVKWWLIIIGIFGTLAILGIIFVAILTAVNPMKQVRVAKCIQSCQSVSNYDACKNTCEEDLPTPSSAPVPTETP